MPGVCAHMKDGKVVVVNVLDLRLLAPRPADLIPELLRAEVEQRTEPTPALAGHNLGLFLLASSLFFLFCYGGQIVDVQVAILHLVEFVEAIGPHRDVLLRDLLHDNEHPRDERELVHAFSIPQGQQLRNVQLPLEQPFLLVVMQHLQVRCVDLTEADRREGHGRKQVEDAEYPGRLLRERKVPVPYRVGRHKRPPEGVQQREILVELDKRRADDDGEKVHTKRKEHPNEVALLGGDLWDVDALQTGGVRSNGLHADRLGAGIGNRVGVGATGGDGDGHGGRRHRPPMRLLRLKHQGAVRRRRVEIEGTLRAVAHAQLGREAGGRPRPTRAGAEGSCRGALDGGVLQGAATPRWRGGKPREAGIEGHGLHRLWP
eukprot:scaffold438_cov250-Pinguiococcus_pyrenoidosus.AAC.25